jgi:hypothetical protein
MVDLTGRIIEVDDEVAVAFKEGNSGALRIGIIRSIFDKVNQLEIEWTAGFNKPQSQTTVINYLSRDRFFILGA